MTKFSKRHYEVIADTFNEVINDPNIGPLGRMALDKFFRKLVEIFKRDNPSFKESKFEDRSLK